MRLRIKTIKLDERRHHTDHKGKTIRSHMTTDEWLKGHISPMHSDDSNDVEPSNTRLRNNTIPRPAYGISLPKRHIPATLIAARRRYFTRLVDNWSQRDSPCTAIPRTAMTHLNTSPSISRTSSRYLREVASSGRSASPVQSHHVSLHASTLPTRRPRPSNFVDRRYGRHGRHSPFIP